MNRPPDQDLTILDIAREAGVSPATVSRVLNGTAGVRADKAERVRAVIARHNYRPNPFARGLLGQQTGVFGVLVPQLEDEFYGKIVTGVERELRREGMHLLCSLGHDDPGEEAQALELFRERQVDGLILLADQIDDAAILRQMEQRVPLVLINRLIPELEPHCLRLDNVRGGYDATRHLLDLGHRRIAHIAGPLERPGARERLDGYRTALREAGLEPLEWLVVESEFSEDGGYLACKRLLGRGEFTALFAGNDQLALGAIAALREAGLEVPATVSVIGFDDRTLARFCFPALTTLHYPMLEMGARAARHLLALLRGEGPPALSRLRPELVVRSSTSAPGS
ncbi:MAG: LacI family DNA-binding transcriptional regulator [Meiothermus sp.]|nr:LacI family DNA-binding transcriptional regulator [Meiothermus sp.]